MLSSYIDTGTQRRQFETHPDLLNYKKNKACVVHSFVHFFFFVAWLVGLY